MKSPRSIELILTNDCNLKCSYCCHFSSTSCSGQDIDTDEWLKFFGELKENAVLNALVAGGEPLIRKDFLTLIDGLAKNNIRFSIISNGMFIDDNIVQYLKSTKRCSSFQVSIDGSTPFEHDICRGKGSFDKTVSGLKLLIKHNIPTTVRVTIHKHNVNLLEKIIPFLLEEIGVRSVSTNNAGHFGLCITNKDHVQLNATEYSIAIESLLKLKKIYKGRITGSAGPLANAKNWMLMENAKQQKIDKTPGGGYLTGCNGMFNKIAVLADGTMTLCTMLTHIKLGKINQDALSDVWNNHPQLIRMRSRCNIPLKNFAYCKDCEYINYCKGGCAALAYSVTGNDSAPAIDACYKAFLQSGGCFNK
jgi:SynChlorMet cassette radical SAM/SPASM protein ScmE